MSPYAHSLFGHSFNLNGRQLIYRELIVFFVLFKHSLSSSYLSHAASSPPFLSSFHYSTDVIHSPLCLQQPRQFAILLTSNDGIFFQICGQQRKTFLLGVPGRRSNKTIFCPFQFLSFMYLLAEPTGKLELHAVKVYRFSTNFFLVRYFATGQGGGEGAWFSQLCIVTVRQIVG